MQSFSFFLMRLPWGHVRKLWETWGEYGKIPVAGTSVFGFFIFENASARRKFASEVFEWLFECRCFDVVFKLLSLMTLQYGNNEEK